MNNAQRAQERRTSRKYPIGFKVVVLLFAVVITVSLLAPPPRQEGFTGATNDPGHVTPGIEYRPGMVGADDGEAPDSTFGRSEPIFNSRM